MVPSQKLSDYLTEKHPGQFSPESLQILDALLNRVALVDITGHRLVLDDSESISFGLEQPKPHEPWPVSSTAGY